MRWSSGVELGGARVPDLRGFILMLARPSAVRGSRQPCLCDEQAAPIAATETWIDVGPNSDTADRRRLTEPPNARGDSCYSARKSRSAALKDWLASTSGKCP